MRRWTCAALAAAAWPLAMLLAYVSLSQPVLGLYQSGLIGDSPVGPMAFVGGGAFIVAAIVSGVLWLVLRAMFACKHEGEPNEEEPPAGDSSQETLW